MENLPRIGAPSTTANRLRLIATSSGKGGEVEGGGAMWGESGILLPPLPDDASPLLSRSHGQFRRESLRLARRLPHFVLD